MSLDANDLLAAGFRVDAERGLVIGKRGRPITKGRPNYIQLQHMQRTVAQAHRFIWECVNGPIPEGMEINHINGIKFDNRICNLELVTPSENSLHAYRIGLKTAVGEKNGRAVLTPDDVRLIRATSAPQIVLARRFGISRSSVRDIKARITWRNVA